MTRAEWKGSDYISLVDEDIAVLATFSEPSKRLDMESSWTQPRLPGRYSASRVKGSTSVGRHEERKWLTNWVHKVNALKAKGEDEADELMNVPGPEAKPEDVELWADMQRWGRTKGLAQALT